MGLAYTDTGVVLTNQANGTVVDSIGIVSSTQFSQSGGTATAEGQVVDTTSEEALTGGTLNVVLARSALVLFNYDAQAYMVPDGANTADCHIYPKVGGTVPMAEKYHITITAGNNSLATYSSFHQEVLPAGTTSFILYGKLSRLEGAASCTVTRHKSFYTVLGK